MVLSGKMHFVRQLAGRFGLSSALVILGRLSTLALFLIGARVAHADQFGLFVFAVAASQVLAMLCNLGTAPASQLFIGEARGLNRPGRIPSFVLFAFVVTAVVSLAVALLLAAAGGLAGVFLAKGSASQILFATAMFVPVMSLSILREYTARAMEQVVLAFAPRDIGWSVSYATAMLLIPGAGDHLVPIGAILLAVIEAPLWFSLWRQALRVAGPGPRLPCRPYRRWTVRSAAMMTNFLAGLGFERIDVLMMGMFTPLSAAGIYGAASRIAPLISTSQRFVIPVLTPKVAEAMSVGRTDIAAREVRLGVMASSAIAIPGAVMVWLFAPFIMSLFGPQFVGGATVLRILSAAHLAISVGSNFSVPLMVSERAWLFAQTIWSALIGAAICMPFAIHFLGAVGAAVTVAVGIVGYNLAVVLLARRILRGGIPLQIHHAPRY